MILTKENVGDWVTRPAWEAAWMVQVKSINPETITVHRNGTEYEYQNDDQFRIVYRKAKPKMARP